MFNNGNLHECWRRVSELGHTHGTLPIFFAYFAVTAQDAQPVKRLVRKQVARSDLTGHLKRGQAAALLTPPFVAISVMRLSPS